MANVRRQISHTCRTDINRSGDYNLRLSNFFRQSGRYIKLAELLTEVLKRLGNLCLSGNLFIRDLLSEWTSSDK